MGEPQPGIYEPGTVLDDKLRIERLLGEGGMGAVYEVTHQMTHRRRALKLLHPQFARQKTTVERFLREATAAGKIDNAHIIETFDAGWLSTGEPFVLMEFLEGETLAARLEAVERMALPEVVAVFQQLCRGVQAAHDAGIVHRDLKPENIFLTQSENDVFVKVLDFGISKFDERHTMTTQPTRSGATVGTPGYMSLEQIDDSADVDEQGDVYSLGVILYETLTGEHPYPATSFLQLAKKVAAGKFKPPSELRPNLPPELDGLMEDLLTPDRDKRLGSAAELADRLDAIADGQEAPIVPAAQPEVSEAPVSGFNDTMAMEEPATVPEAPALHQAPKKPQAMWWAVFALAAAGLGLAARSFTAQEPQKARLGLSSAVIPSSVSIEPPTSIAPSVSVPKKTPKAPPSTTTSKAPTPVAPVPRPPPPSDPDYVGENDDI